MIPISKLFEDPDEQLIEDLTVYCINKYGNSFLESVLRFFETDTITEVEGYFDKEFDSLFEIVKPTDKFKDRDINDATNDMNDSAEMGKEREVRWHGKRYSDIRKLTHRMSKSKVGKAIVKGVRKAAYGTKLGRRIVRRHAAKVQRQADKHIAKARRHGKAATRLKFEELKRKDDIGVKTSDIRYKLRDKAHSQALKAGNEGTRGKKIDRTAHQLRRNADLVEKKQKAKKAVKAGIGKKRKFTFARA